MIVVSSELPEILRVPTAFSSCVKGGSRATSSATASAKRRSSPTPLPQSRDDRRHPMFRGALIHVHRPTASPPPLPRQAFDLSFGLRDAGTLSDSSPSSSSSRSLTPNFLTERNLLNILQQSSINACVALGMTLVIIAAASTCRWARPPRSRPSWPRH